MPPHELRGEMARPVVIEQRNRIVSERGFDPAITGACAIRSRFKLPGADECRGEGSIHRWRNGALQG